MRTTVCRDTCYSCLYYMVHCLPNIHIFDFCSSSNSYANLIPFSNFSAKRTSSTGLCGFCLFILTEWVNLYTKLLQKLLRETCIIISNRSVSTRIVMDHLLSHNFSSFFLVSHNVSQILKVIACHSSPATKWNLVFRWSPLED